MKLNRTAIEKEIVEVIYHNGKDTCALEHVIASTSSKFDVSPMEYSTYSMLVKAIVMQMLLENKIGLAHRYSNNEPTT